MKSPHKGQWRGALTFSLIYAWINGWVNNREAGDLSRHRAHHDVIVMKIVSSHSGTHSSFLMGLSLEVLLLKSHEDLCARNKNQYGGTMALPFETYYDTAGDRDIYTLLGLHCLFHFFISKPRVSTESQISPKFVLLWHASQLLNHFEVLHKARQCHCRALCKISKRFGNRTVRYGQMSFRDICFWDAFRTDVIYCNNPAGHAILLGLFPWWRQMETSSALLTLCAGNSPVTGEFPSQRPVNMFSLICVWINSWVNNRGAGDLRHHHAHYDVIVMSCILSVVVLSGNQRLLWTFEIWSIGTETIALLGQVISLNVSCYSPTIHYLNRWLPNDAYALLAVGGEYYLFLT